MDIESIRKFVSLLAESAIFINSIDKNPITPDNYAGYQRLRPALNGSFRQLDIDTEFYNELDLDRKKEILRTLRTSREYSSTCTEKRQKVFYQAMTI